MATPLGSVDTEIKKPNIAASVDTPAVQQTQVVPEKQYADTPDVDPSNGATMGSSTRMEVRKPQQYEDYPTIADYKIPGILSGSNMPVGNQMALKYGIPFSSSPQQLVDIVKNNIPGAKFTTDKYGNPLAVIDGEKYHLDRPGLNSLDVTRGIVKSSAALPAAIAAGTLAPVEAAGLPLALGAQAIAGTGQNLIEQGITKAAGSEQPISPSEAVTAGAMQSAFPAAAKGLQTFYQLMAPDIFAQLPRGAQTFFKKYADKLRFPEIKPSDNVTDFMLDDPRMKSIASEIMLQDSPASDVIHDAIQNRLAGTQQRLFDSLDEHLGPQLTTDREYDAILKQSQGLLSDKLTPVLDAAPPLDPSGIVANIDRQLINAKGSIKNALEKIRSFYVNKPATPEIPAQRFPVTDANGNVIRYEMKPSQPATAPQYETSAQGLQNSLNAVDSLIKYGDDTIGIARNSLPGKNAAFTQIRKNTRDLLGQVDGYSDIMGSKSNLYDMSDANVAGSDILRKGENAVEPYQVKNFLSDPDTAEAIKNGSRTAIENVLRESNNDIGALRRALGDPKDRVRENLELIYGKKNIDNLVSSVEREAKYQETANSLIKARGQGINKIGPETTEEVEKPILGNLSEIPQKAIATPINYFDRLLRGQSGQNFDLGRAKFLTSRGPEIANYQSGFQKALARNAATTPLQQLAPAVSGRIPGYTESLGEASGGRVGHASGGKVGVLTPQALLADLKRRKVMLANKTEQMLSLPDDAVVQALDAAKR